MSTPPAKVKSTLKSRINLLQQTLHFKSSSSSFAKDEQQVVQTPKSNLNGSAESELSTINVRSSSITSIPQKSPSIKQSNVLNGIKEHKYDAIATLFITKTKMPTEKWTGAHKEDAVPNTQKQSPQRKSLHSAIASREFQSKYSSKEVSNPSTSEIVSQLINQWKQENITQKKISLFLLENYKKDPSLLSSILKENAYDIAKANMRLIVCAIKQEAIEDEIKRIGKSPQVNGTLVNIGRGRVALYQISLPMRVHTPNIYVFCIVRHQDKVFASTMLNASSFSHDKAKNVLQFEIDKVFDNLEPDFKIVVQFYFCNLSVQKHENHLSSSSMSKIIKQFKKAFKCVKFFKACVFDKKKPSSGNENQAWNNKLNFLNTDCDNIDLVSVVGSSFKLFGSMTIHRGNCTDSQHNIEQFDYFLSPSEDQVYLQQESSIDFGKSIVYSLGVHVEQHPPLDVNDKAIKIAKFKFVKRFVEIDGKHLKVCSKRADLNQDKFDLDCCLNSVNIEEATVNGLENTICLLFTELSEYHGEVHFGRRNSAPQYQFVFFASTSHELLSEFFNKTMAQVTAVRQWKEPVLYGNSIPLDHSPIAELQESVYEENLMSTESSIISKLVIA